MRRLAIAFLLLPSACGLFLGIDDYTYEPAVDAATPDRIAFDDGAVDAGVDAEGGLVCAPCAGPSSGPCGIACNEPNPTLLALDGTRLAWVASATAIRTASTTGGGPVTIVTAPSAPVALTATGGAVVWADATSLRSATDGGTTVITSEPGVSSLTGAPATLPPGVLHWTNASTGKLRHCGLAACSTTIVDQITGREKPTSLVAASDGKGGIYGVWVDRGTSTRSVTGAPLLGGITLDPLVQGPLVTDVIAVDPDDHTAVYYATNDGKAGTLFKVGSGVVGSVDGPIVAIAARGSHVFALTSDFGNPKLGRLVRYDLPGLARTVLATGVDTPTALAVDSAYAYFTTATAVLRVAR